MDYKDIRLFALALELVKAEKRSPELSNEFIHNLAGIFVLNSEDMAKSEKNQKYLYELFRNPEKQLAEIGARLIILAGMSRVEKEFKKRSITRENHLVEEKEE